MLKQLRKKWRLWENAFLGINDLHGDYLIGLEKRLTRLETAVAELRNAPREEIPCEDGRIKDK